MKDFSLFKHRYFNTPNKRISVLSIILIALSVLIVASLIGEQNLDIREQAKMRDEQSIASGCYYKLPCPVRNSGDKPQFNCRPILVCPKPTSAPKLTCGQCLENNLQQLCFDPAAKVSYCLGADTVVDGVSCVSCADTTPTPGCIPRPSCVDNPPYCLLPEPIGGWCKITPTPRLCLQVFTPARNKLTGECKLFPTSCLPDGWVADRSCVPSPTTVTRITPTCVPPPPCVFSEPYCAIAPPEGGWCPTTTTYKKCPTPPPCRGTLIYGDPSPNDVNRCPVYRCITTSPTSGSTVLPQ